MVIAKKKKKFISSGENQTTMVCVVLDPKAWPSTAPRLLWALLSMTLVNESPWLLQLSESKIQLIINKKNLLGSKLTSLVLGQGISVATEGKTFPWLKKPCRNSSEFTGFICRRVLAQWAVRNSLFFYIFDKWSVEYDKACAVCEDSVCFKLFKNSLN